MDQCDSFQKDQKKTGQDYSLGVPQNVRRTTVLKLSINQNQV